MDNTGYVTAQQGVVNQTDLSTQTKTDAASAASPPRKTENVENGYSTAVQEIELPSDFAQRIAEIQGRLGMDKPVSVALEVIVGRIADNAPEKLETQIDELDSYSREGGSIERFIRITSNLAALYRQVTSSVEDAGNTGVSYKEVAQELAADFSPSEPPFPFNQDFIKLYNEYLERLVSGEGQIGKLTAERLAQEQIAATTETGPEKPASSVPDTPADAALSSVFDAEA